MLYLLGLIIILGIGLKGLAIHSQRQTLLTGLDAQGHLQPLPQSPNGINSEDPSPERRVAPLSFTGDADAAWQRLQQLLEATDGVVIQSVDGDYLHATASSRLFGFVDDVECRLDRQEEVIHLRSASRVGHYDFGANRRRAASLQVCPRLATS